ncbi:MAG TPA: hypothetical protein VKU19_04845 [Bryobacteraceae bacterium]|nr:hypothetical protein [Bryobacteraceae bacterium]
MAVSDDDGETWQTRQLPGIVTVGYTTATQAPNGVIHIVTSKNAPDLHIELNETWVQQGGPETAAPGLLSGPQTFSYANGQKQWQRTLQNGRPIGIEAWWSEDGRRLWEKNHSPDGTWTWKLFNSAGKVIAESHWRGKNLLDAML